MDEILYLNGKRVRLRTCNHVFSERLAVISHGRYTPLLPHVSASVNRMDISVHWYVRHGETISNHNVIKIFELLHQGRYPESQKDYSGRIMVKNYSLRPEPALERCCTPRAGGKCDVLNPVDPVTTQDIIEGINNNVLKYNIKKFISFRAGRSA
ncbi:putative adhesin [Escherichia coli]|uniref:putative adhesin n=1 Tax=unclassified Escherichia TaxID=2608889 RepID=UPI00403F3A38